MSYIRPLSNPEGLYVYQNIGGWISFTWANKAGQLYEDENCSAKLDLKSWKKLTKIWRKMDHFFGKIVAGNITIIRDVEVDDAGNIYPKYQSLEEMIVSKRYTYLKNQIIIRQRVKGKRVKRVFYLYDVTLRYFMDNAAWITPRK